MQKASQVHLNTSPTCFLGCLIQAEGKRKHTHILNLAFEIRLGSARVSVRLCVTYASGTPTMAPIKQKTMCGPAHPKLIVNGNEYHVLPSRCL